MKQELIAALERAGMVYVDKSEDYEGYAGISWPEAYEASKVVGDPEFAPEFPVSSDDNSLSVFELETGLYLDNLSQIETTAIVEQVAAFIAGRYFAHAAGNRIVNA